MLNYQAVADPRLVAQYEFIPVQTIFWEQAAIPMFDVLSNELPEPKSFL
jgi:hypothetical protein